MKFLMGLTGGLLFIAANALGGSKGFLDGYACAPKILNQLGGWGAAQHWTREVDPAPTAQAYRTHTSKIGVWVEVHLQSDHSAKVFKISPEGVTEFNWNKKGCAEIQVSKPKGRILPETENGKKYFTDNDLATLLKDHKNGMIYIWSPGMVYSMDTYPNFKKVAAKMNLHLTVLMDPTFDESDAAKTAKLFKMPFFDQRVESVELLMRDITDHYPQTLIYANGKLSNHHIVGAMDVATLETEVGKDLTYLK